MCNARSSATFSKPITANPKGAHPSLVLTPPCCEAQHEREDLPTVAIQGISYAHGYLLFIAHLLVGLTLSSNGVHLNGQKNTRPFPPLRSPLYHVAMPITSANSHQLLLFKPYQKSQITYHSLLNSRMQAGHSEGRCHIPNGFFS